jgi:hypothetical protein
MPGRGEPQGAGIGVEDDHHQRDEFLGPFRGEHLGVELLERLGGVAVLAQEHPQQVLGLEGGDGRLDPPAGHIADNRGDARWCHPEHVEEVAGHDAGAGLVHTAELEARELGQVLGRQPGGPALGRQLLLAEDLLGLALDGGAILGQLGLAREVAPECHRQRHRNEDQHEQQAGDVLPRHHHAGRGDGEHGVQAGGVEVLAKRRSRQHRDVGVGTTFALDPPPHDEEAACRSSPHDGRHERRDRHEGEDRLHVGQDATGETALRGVAFT